MISGKQIREKRKAEKLSAQGLAEKLKVSKDNLYKWEKGHQPQNAEDYIKVESWLNDKLENVPHEMEIKSEPEVDYSNIKELTLSNRALAEANKTLADAHYLISKNSEELIQLAKAAFNLHIQLLAGQEKMDAKGEVQSAADELHRNGHTGPFEQPKKGKR
jgi:predicted transcriptional regulator